MESVNRCIIEKLKMDIHSANDIWYIWNVLEKNDKIFVETYRVVEEFNEKKKVKLVLEIEKLKYLKDFKSLRITGKIIEGEPSDYVQIGKYHGFDITEQSEFILMKEQLEKYKIDLLNEAVKRSKDLIGNIVLIDERKVMIANLYPIGVEIIFEKDIPFSKMENQNREKFYREIQEYLKSDKIIVAGPGFEKENLSKFLNKKVS
jgi:stalled ribosome rescue protein Dom34